MTTLLLELKRSFSIRRRMQKTSPNMTDGLFLDHWAETLSDGQLEETLLRHQTTLEDMPQEEAEGPRGEWMTAEQTAIETVMTQRGLKLPW